MFIILIIITAFARTLTALRSGLRDDAAERSIRRYVMKILITRVGMCAVRCCAKSGVVHFPRMTSA